MTALRTAPLLVRRGPFALLAYALRGRSGEEGAVAANTAATLATLPQALQAATARGDICLWMQDEREITVLCRQALLEPGAGALPPPTHSQRDFALLTIDQDFAWDVTGVLAALTGALARAGVPAGALSAFSRDHLLVPAARLPEALAALREVCGEVRDEVRRLD
ncbi:MAG: ACT domain-containing protein [Planctomycetota bacterium]